MDCKADHRTRKTVELDQKVQKLDGIDDGIVEVNFAVIVDNLMQEGVKSDAGHMGHEEMEGGQVNMVVDVDDEGSGDYCCWVELKLYDGDVDVDVDGDGDVVNGEVVMRILD